jgi:selenocysteine lyase/cysteine desulfurase
VQDEFPANIYPFMKLQKEGVEIDFVPTRYGLIKTEDIEKSIKPQTKLLSISFVEFLNGFRNQLQIIGEICKANHVIFSVDGIQGVGAIPVSVRRCGIDFLSNGGHKWLMGPQGCGFMYITPALFEKLNPAFVGWLSVKDSWNFFDYNLDLVDDGGRFEIGTANVIGIFGLLASSSLLIEAGIAGICDHLLRLGERLIHGLTALNYQYIGSDNREERSGIYSFRVPNEQLLFDHLKQKRVHISLREDVLRFSPHFYNSESDIDQVIRLCKQYLG